MVWVCALVSTDRKTLGELGKTMAPRFALALAPIPIEPVLGSCVGSCVDGKFCAKRPKDTSAKVEQIKSLSNFFEFFIEVSNSN